MNKQEILNEENERWKPKEGEKFFFIDAWTRACYKNYKETDRCCYEYYSTYNCFKTEKEAEEEAEKISIRRMLEDIARRLNKSKEIDWNNFAQDKYFLGIDYNKYLAMGVGLSCCNNIRTQGTVYCLNRNFKDVAIQEIGEERLKSYLRGE